MPRATCEQAVADPLARALGEEVSYFPQAKNRGFDAATGDIVAFAGYRLLAPVFRLARSAARAACRRAGWRRRRSHDLSPRSASAPPPARSTSCTSRMAPATPATSTRTMSPFPATMCLPRIASANMRCTMTHCVVLGFELFEAGVDRVSRPARAHDPSLRFCERAAQLRLPARPRYLRSQSAPRRVHAERPCRVPRLGPVLPLAGTRARTGPSVVTHIARATRCGARRRPRGPGGARSFRLFHSLSLPSRCELVAIGIRSARRRGVAPKLAKLTWRLGRTEFSRHRCASAMSTCFRRRARVELCPHCASSTCDCATVNVQQHAARGVRSDPTRARRQLDVVRY